MPSHEAADAYPVYLISGELPGCGSTTVAEKIGSYLLRQTGLDPEVIFVGQRVRQLIGAQTEAQMAESLQNIPDPTSFDAQIYADLPMDRPVVIEGKLATQIGPQYITGRPIKSVTLTVHPFQSAVRVMQREGIPYEDMFGAHAEEDFMRYYKQTRDRTDHITELQQNSAWLSPSDDTLTEAVSVNTTGYSSDEVVGLILGCDGISPELGNGADLDGINAFAAKLMTFAIRLNGYNQNPLDKEHFDYNFKNLRYQMQRLHVNLGAGATHLLQENIKGTIIDSTFSLFMRSVPRFYRRGEDEIVVDSTSVKWTPEFYKIAMAMPTLKTLIAGKTVLDPFGGAGSLMFYLAAREVPKAVFCSDICYRGGLSLDDDDTTYEPDLNQQSITTLFASLPSWCRPRFDRMKGFVTADAMRLPLRDRAVDIIVGDPPYGVNCTQGSAHTLTLALPELLRVSREGVLTMIPLSWVPTLERSPYTVKKLTNDLSLGSSNLPTCYVHISASESVRTT